MNFINILSAALNGFTQVTLFNEGLNNVPLTGVSSLVAKIIEFFSFSGSIGVGIILFTLILKVIPLPLDIYSRASSKKNALKMEKMRPELEKLQKQYANNKELYQRKMMALYKKEGYSQFSACLPSIFTLVFFIIVITAFSQYSTYTKIETYNQMATAFSNDIIKNENVYLFEFDKDELGSPIQSTAKQVDKNIEKSNDKFYIYYHNLNEQDYQNKILMPAQEAAANKYFEESEKSSFLWVKNIWIEDLPWKKAFINKEDYLNKTFTYNKGCSNKEITSVIKNEDAYDLIFGSPRIKELQEKPNGLLILVILSILSMVGSQFVMNKTQKAQMELQSVDGANGQAAQTSKMMMWMMPIMFGIFAFVYTASFSIYLIMSTVISTLSTIIINVIVEKSFKKKLIKEEEDKYNKRYGYLNKTKKD